MPQNLKNVVVLGGSYGGATAANRLAQTLPKDYRVVLIERNTHANHLYVFPRMSVLPGHEHKAFIPYTHIFDPIPLIAGTSGSSSSANSESSRAASPEPETEPEPCRHIYLHAHVVGLGENVVKLDRAFPEYGFDSPEVPFEYAVYALGSRLPAPIDLWAGVDGDEVVGEVVGKEEESPEESSDVHEEEASDVDEEKEALKKEAEEAEKETPRVYTGSKTEAVEWMRRCQERIKGMSSVLVVGGGALGIQFATDIASLYPDKKVTLLHSRNRLLPRYAPEMHSEIMKAMSDLGVTVILDERLDLSTIADSQKKGAERVVKTLKGREIAAELVMLCTGQVPNTAPLRTLDESIVRPDSGLACVLRTMQVASCGQEGDYLLEPVVETEPEVEVEQDEDEVDETEAEVEEVVEGVKQTSLEDAEVEPAVEEDSTPVEPATAAPISKSQPRSPHPNIFVVGDAADAFGAIKAGHVAFYQAQVAVANINKMIAARVSGEGENGEEVELERYEPSAPAIKVSLGLTRPAVYEIHGQIGFKEGADDLDAGSMWPYFGFYNPSPEDLYL